MTAAAGESHQQHQQLAARVYELETAAAQLRETNERSLKTIERLEKDHQRALDELEALHKSHSRLESQFFANETELGSLRSKLERAQRATVTLERSLDAKAAAADKEREAWQRREAELSSELAIAKRKATVQRRQTVSSPTPSHKRSSSMYAHDMPMPHLVSPLMAARTIVREDPQSTDNASALDDQAQAQAQLRQMTRRLREAEARAQVAAQQAARMQAEAHHATGELESAQRKADRLEHTVRQLNELNESLREDNESYQVLMQMSALKGGFSLTNQRASLDSRGSGNNNSSGGNTADGGFAGCPSFASDEPLAAAGLDLASELGQVLALDGDSDGGESGRRGASQSRLSALEELNTQLKEDLRKTKYERRQLSDENKALSLYVTKILGRIMASSDGLEAVLSRDYDPKRKPLTTFSTPAPPVNHSSRPRNPISPAPTLAQTLSPASNRSSSSSRPPHVASLSFAEPGSGDGINSVFVPPTSPTLARPQSPPPYTRRTRSATVAVGGGDGRLPDPAAADSTSATPATVSSGSGSGGTWWKRMSVLRLGSVWTPPEETHAE
ncbi:hypothetical protein FB645_004513 [Coemansia sp. IMI 203386]|nr:hypothetical protein FB645_004513 [Coemansia sp. IMI 203386]